MALCEQCGSIQIVRAAFESADRLVATFTAKRPFLCRRCGWRGRRNWTDKDLEQLLDYGAGGAETDPALAVLDRPRPTPGRRKRHTSGRTKTKSEADSPLAFDLGALNVAYDNPIQGDRRLDEKHSSKATVAGRRRKRRKHSRRREIVATMAVTALVLFLIAILGVTGSCVGGSDG